MDTTLRNPKKHKHANEEPTWFKQFSDDVERRHQEKMQMQERMIAVIEIYLSNT